MYMTVYSTKQSLNFNLFFNQLIKPQIYHLSDSRDDLAAIVAGRAVFAYPLVSSKVSISPGFKGCIPLRLSPTPSSKRVLGHY